MLQFIIFICYIVFFIPLIKNIIKKVNSPFQSIKWKFSIIFAFCGVFILTVILIFLRIYVNILWFSEMGYLQRFYKIILTKLYSFIIFTLIAFIFLWWNFRAIRWVDMRYGKIIRLLIPILIAPFFGIAVLGEWNKILFYIYKTNAGILDPIFNKDVGFYLFSLPFYQFISSWFLGLILLTFILVEIFYLSNRFINLAVKHGVLLGIGLFLIFIVKTIIAKYNLLYSQRGVVFGASYADIHAQIPAYYIFIAITLVVIVFLVRAKTTKSIFTALGIWFFGFLIVAIYPNLVQYFSVRPNELDKEREYINYNIKFTSIGFGIQDVEEKELDVIPLNKEIIARNKSILDNIRLWDPRALLYTYKQLQEMRLYYEFTDVDIDRYWVNGKYTQVMLSCREFNQNKLPEKSKTWINKRFKYTHGYGLCLIPVNEFLPGGLPNFLIKDMPPQSDIIKINQPEIYYGELTREHIFVNAATDEFDYPRGDENVYCKYKGKGGILLNNFLRKFAFALHFDGIKLLLSKYLTKETRIIINRQIMDRMKTIAPFLKYDKDPYIVISDDGKLFWICDAYTISDRFPYSERFVFYSDTINYIRNSVKVVIDAYNGDTKFYIFDEKDPIIKTYQNIFPDLFLKKSDFPKDLLSHIRYPEDLINIQAQVYAIYHMKDENVFYNREDMWQIAKEKYIERIQNIIPYYIIAKLDTENEFIQMIPFTPFKKDNVVGWLASRCDGVNYGKLLVYKFPKERLTYGPMQIEAKIDQDPEISAQLTLWSQHGSQVIRGNILVVPLENSILYVEPLYLQATESKIPELKKVIIASSDKLVWADNFNDAIAKLLEYKIEEEAPVEEKLSVYDYIKSALENFNEYKRLMGKGDFKEAGSKLKLLEKALKEAIK